MDIESKQESEFFKRIKAEVENSYTMIKTEDVDDVAFEKALEKVFKPDKNEGEDR